MAPVESTVEDLLIGQTIGSNFRLIQRLGSGAMGRVFQAEQISLGKMVAIKVMRSELMSEPNLIQRFELEARAASALNHPNLIQILDFGRDRSFLFIAMELLEGIDLATVLSQEGALAMERAVWIIDQVLSGLVEAHTHGVVHRDLKPENIILVPRGEDPDFVKVCDFGVAKTNGREQPNLTMAGLVFGTPEYMSPEQARGVNVDCRSDLYSVATILYELLVGEIPFASGSPVGIMGRQLFDQPAPPSSHPNVLIPVALENLIMRGLAKAADDRPQTATEFQAELHDAMVGIIDRWPGQVARTPSVSRGPSQRTAAIAGPAPAPPPPRRRRTLVAAAAGALTLLVLAGAGAYSLASRPGPPPRPQRTAVAAPKTAVRSAARLALVAEHPPEDEDSEDEALTGPLPNARPEADEPERGPGAARLGAARGKLPSRRARPRQPAPAPKAVEAPTIAVPPAALPAAAPASIIPLLDLDSHPAPRPVSDRSP